MNKFRHYLVQIADKLYLTNYLYKIWFIFLGFKNGISVDALYLKINVILEYNLPYVQSDFMCNLGPTNFSIAWLTMLF